MISKTELNKKAVALRRKGLTYSEILSQIPVAKSTLALWFKEVKLSKPQVQKITKRKLAAGKRGGIARKKQRIKKVDNIRCLAEREVGNISDRELWLIGTVIYWAEGAKEKEWHPGSGASFINMDPFMIQVYLRWLKYCGIQKSDINFMLFVHENHSNRVPEIKRYWSKIANFPISAFSKQYWKKNKVNTKRRNVGDNYFGILKINIKQSSEFLRKVMGWTTGIYKGINKG